MTILSDDHRSARDEEELVEELRSLFLLARDEKRSRYDTWVRNYRLVNNKLGGQGTTSWMPTPRDSEIYPMLSAIVAWQTDQNVSIDVYPAADPSSPFSKFYGQLANDLAEVLYTSWQVEKYDQQIKLAAWDSLIYGTGVLKTVWDNGLSGGYGNAFLRRVDPWAFYPDPNCTSLDDMEYCVEARRMSFDELERRFPDKTAQLEAALISSGEGLDEKPGLQADVNKSPKANPGALPSSGTIGSLGGSSSSFRWGNVSSSKRLWDPLPGIVVYEYWLRENAPYEDEDLESPEGLSERKVSDAWRVVVVANNLILMDEMAADLASFDSHPYERFTWDDIGEFWGVSLVDHLAFPQIYINRLLTALQQNAELVGNPIFLEPKNSGLDRIGMINRPGQRLPVNSNALGQSGGGPQWLTPPSMPESVNKLVEFWIQRMENISGISALTKGQTPTSRASEGSMSTIQEAMFVRIRSALKNLEWCLEKASYKLMDLIIDNFDEPRFMSIIGPNGQMTSKLLRSKHFDVENEAGSGPLKYSLILKAGSSTPTSRQARINEADKLFTIGVIDDEAVLEAHQYPNAQTIIDRKYDKMAKGLFNPPGARQRSTKSS